MGYVPEPRPPRLRFDKNGLPLDFPTYMWQTYGKRVEDRSPQRMASNMPPWPDRGPTIPSERR